MNIEKAREKAKEYFDTFNGVITVEILAQIIQVTSEAGRQVGLQQARLNQ